MWLYSSFQLFDVIGFSHRISSRRRWDIGEKGTAVAIGSYFGVEDARNSSGTAHWGAPSQMI
jgi:hypothetical protein